MVKLPRPRLLKRLFISWCDENHIGSINFSKFMATNYLTEGIFCWFHLLGFVLCLPLFSIRLIVLKNNFWDAIWEQNSGLLCSRGRTKDCLNISLIHTVQQGPHVCPPQGSLGEQSKYSMWQLQKGGTSAVKSELWGVLRKHVFYPRPRPAEVEVSLQWLAVSWRPPGRNVQGLRREGFRLTAHIYVQGAIALDTWRNTL